MENELVQALIGAAVVLIPAIAGFVAYYLKGYIKQAEEKIKQEVGASQYSDLMEWAQIFIRAAEQKLGFEGDQVKKDFVSDALSSLAEDLGLQISDEQIDALIEGIYNQLKNSLTPQGRAWPRGAEDEADENDENAPEGLQRGSR